MVSENGKRLALLAAGLLFGLVLAEIGVRLIEPREVLREYFVAHDPVLHHRFIPGARGLQKTVEFEAAYSINSLGLRGKEISREKPVGTRRLLMLGDSFTEGIGVNQAETFSSRLQHLLHETAYGRNWQVINAGVGSYSPLLEYLYLRSEGVSIEPDLVILNFDLSDVYDDVQYTKLAVLDAQGAPVAVVPEEKQEEHSFPVEGLIWVKDFFKEETRLYNFMRRRISLSSPRAEGFLSGDLRFDKYGMLREGAPGRNEHHWELSFGYLLRIRDLLKARGIDFWVTVYPYGLQVSPREWGKGRIFWGFEQGRLYSTRPQALVEDFCRENHIPVLNMCATFREESQRTYPLYYEGDGHWRPVGHWVAATAIYRALDPYVKSWRARHPPRRQTDGDDPGAAFSSSARTRESVT